MTFRFSPAVVRRIMAADAASCLACGVLQVVLPGRLAGWFALPASLLLVSGVMLLGFAALGFVFATRPQPPRAGVGLFVAGNLAWAVGCGVLLFAGIVSPSALGMAWIALQAITVVVLAELQWMALRRPAGCPAVA